ncbi:hypothetical protein DL768_010414 [Monosporascus sp. mg162]|nr:hypothetical protein DL768_010414 [Monosporascus sp. mg162]
MGLFYVLLIERRDEKWERVGVGKVFEEAFRDARWKEIMLEDVEISPGAAFGVEEKVAQKVSFEDPGS